MKSIQASFRDYKKKKMKRIKHNDLIHYFLREHSELPPAYLASCEKFFKDIEQRKGIKFAGKFKPEASSSKLQASSATKKTQL